MTKQPDPHFRRDLIKLAFLVAVLIGMAALFFLTPALSTPTLLSIIITLFFSPPLAALERRGYPRALSIILLFGTLGVAATYGGFAAIHSAGRELDSLKQTAPKTVQMTIEKMKTIEKSWKNRYPFLESIRPTEALLQWARDSWHWVVKNGTAVMGDLITCLLLVPFITFVLLHDGITLKNTFLDWFPTAFLNPCLLSPMRSVRHLPTTSGPNPSRLSWSDS